MTYFTQLGLSGEPERKPENTGVRKASGTGQRSQPEGKKFSGKQKTAVVICSLIATSLLGVSLLETGCSKESDKSTRISAPSPASAGTGMSESAAATQQTTLAPAPVAAKKHLQNKSRQRTLVASTYSNPVYGVTFQYPKRYSLKEGDKADMEWTALKPAQMNFVQPGGNTLSAVELPGRLYPGTDFASAFFNLSVNTKLTAAECGQFASPAASHVDGTPSEDAATASAETAPSTEASEVKVGAAEFTEVESSSVEAAKHSDAKYYHVFQNGACYEFALGLETKGDGATGGMKSVDHNEVFRKLNWMLSTVKIQPAGVPAPAIPTEFTAGGGKD
jgi:hypothetical protein